MQQGITPPQSFYQLSTVTNAGKDFSFEQLKGHYVLIVNTASNCGYTGQYEELEKLYSTYKDKLAILAFPANDFKNQEEGDDAAIAAFCKLHYNIGFPLMKKSTVVKSADQNPVFAWLSDAALNGWNQQEPTWNFSKYLVDPDGKLMGYFDPAVSPLSSDITKNFRTAH